MKRPLLFILLFVLAHNLAGQPVPTGDRVYDLIEQAVRRGVIEPLPSIHQFSRMEVARVLVEIEDARRAGKRLPDPLPGEVRRRIELFRPEIERIVGGDWWDALPDHENRLSGWCRRSPLEKFLPESMFTRSGHVFRRRFPSGPWLSVDPSFVFQYDYNPLVPNRLADYGNTTFRRRWGFVLEAGAFPWLTAWLRWRDAREWGRGPYPGKKWYDRSRIFDDRIGYINPNEIEAISYEDLTGGVLVEHGPVRFLLGRDQLRWGPGRKGNLLLSGEAYPFTQARLTISFHRNVNYTVLAGSLVPWPELSAGSYLSPRG